MGNTFTQTLQTITGIVSATEKSFSGVEEHTSRRQPDFKRTDTPIPPQQLQNQFCQQTPIVPLFDMPPDQLASLNPVQEERVSPRVDLAQITKDKKPLKRLSRPTQKFTKQKRTQWSFDKEQSLSPEAIEEEPVEEEPNIQAQDSGFELDKEVLCVREITTSTSEKQQVVEHEPTEEQVPTAQCDTQAEIAC